MQAVGALRSFIGMLGGGGWPPKHATARHAVGNVRRLQEFLGWYEGLASYWPVGWLAVAILWTE